MNKKQNGYLDLKVGYRCNNDCIHCVIRDYEAALIAEGKDLNYSTQECLEIIRSAPQRGVGTITITGGEPTIRSDFFELLKACYSADLSVGVQTNGRCFHDADFCKRLHGCGSPRFVVALHGADAEIHDAISQRTGSFAQTSRGMQNLCEAGYHVTGKLVISRLNANCLVRTMELMASFGIRNACFAFPHGHGNARVNYKEIVPCYSEIRDEIDRLTEKADKLSFDLSLEAFPLCVLNDPQYVSEFQFLAPRDRRCIPSQSEEYDWDVLRPLDKQKFTQCAMCSCDPYCEGPWKEYPQTYGDHEFRPQAPDVLLNLLAIGFSLRRSGDEV